MAFVSIPKDLNKVKEKVMFNLTKRQLICFGIGGTVGLIAFFIFRGISIQAGVISIVISAFPAMFFSIYEKDGQPPEKIIRNIIRVKIIYPKIRPYKTENIYSIIDKQIQLEKEVMLIEKAERQHGQKPTKSKKTKRKPTNK